ncbi:molecular chaperone IbpA [Glaciecola punicea ACAM 611]|uniref:Molecular chaperone IbpA n=1 Tax=Glaciecola punicea ACAM 611 TaxID=1121923 RepID=H5TBF2_9ALTE|nr:Hsp20 family protein [Glaciecola punicea]GAB55629.1 molecular chaperone IbpA [Glaciecola punicea ACAM 611]
MRTIDLSPLYRSFIGSDHLASMIDTANRQEKQTSYPPYNIELLGEDKYRITMAVAGFAKDDVIIEVQENTLKVTGNKESETENASKEPGSEETQQRKYLHKGISERNFERKFQLGDNVKVLAADLQHGMLHIDLERVVPEAQKPRRIDIGSTVIENQ